MPSQVKGSHAYAEEGQLYALLMFVQAISILVFEYNTMNLWQNVTLQSVVSYMELQGNDWQTSVQGTDSIHTDSRPCLLASLRAGYVCYMEGMPFIFKISRGCWNRVFEWKSFSNVVS